MRRFPQRERFLPRRMDECVGALRMAAHIKSRRLALGSALCRPGAEIGVYELKRFGKRFDLQFRKLSPRAVGGHVDLEARRGFAHQFHDGADILRTALVERDESPVEPALLREVRGEGVQIRTPKRIILARTGAHLYRRFLAARTGKPVDISPRTHGVGRNKRPESARLAECDILVEERKIEIPRTVFAAGDADH